MSSLAKSVLVLSVVCPPGDGRSLFVTVFVCCETFIPFSYGIINSHSTSARWIRDDIIANKARSAIIISYPTSASGIIVLFNTPSIY